MPELRKAGLGHATGDVVAFLEDHATVVPEWADALRTGYARGDRLAVGGPVAQADGKSSVDWGAYLFDYGRFMPPTRGGNVRDLSGLNMSFSRALLSTLGAVLEKGVVEGPLHEALAARGVTPYLSPSAIVIQNRKYAFQKPWSRSFTWGAGMPEESLRRGGSPDWAGRRPAWCCLPFWSRASSWSRSQTAGPGTHGGPWSLPADRARGRSASASGTSRGRAIAILAGAND